MKRYHAELDLIRASCELQERRPNNNVDWHSPANLTTIIVKFTRKPVALRARMKESHEV